MKKAMLMLFATAFIVCAAASAGFDGAADSTKQEAFDHNWDEGQYHDHNCGHHELCTMICPGTKHYDKCGCDHQFAEQSEYLEKHLVECSVFEECDECGITFCDGRCDECGERCDVYEYCPVCKVKYSCMHADGYCDYCGGDCYCIEKCKACGHNHYFNGYCDECAGRCFYARCCHDSYDMNCPECQNRCKDDASSCGCDKLPDKCSSCMGKESGADAQPAVFTIYLGEESSADAEPVMQEGYPSMKGIDPALLNGYADEMSSGDSPADEARAS